MDATQELAKPINPIDKLLPVIAQAVAEWQFAYGDEHLKASVKAKLNSNVHNITLKLLGFEEDRWEQNKWSIDNCNGRAASTAVGQYMKDVQAEAIKEWLAEIPMPKMTPALKKRLEKVAQTQYEDRLEDHVRRHAQSRAEADAAALVSQLVVSQTLNDYIRALKLINMEE